MTTKGTLYMIPCPIADTNDVYEVLPAANRRIMDSLDYFIVENTRTARRFLSRAGIARPIDSLEFVELNEHTRSETDIVRSKRGVRQALYPKRGCQAWPTPERRRHWRRTGAE